MGGRKPAGRAESRSMDGEKLEEDWKVRWRPEIGCGRPGRRTYRPSFIAVACCTSERAAGRLKRTSLASRPPCDVKKGTVASLAPLG